MHAAHGPPGPAAQQDPTPFGAQWWEDHYVKSDDAPVTSPTTALLAEVSDLTPGTALDAGCGTGADAVMLARQGWQVTAVDVSPTTVRQTRALVERQDADVASRVSALVADLAGWRPPRQYDLVISLCVYPVLPFADFISRLADAVAPGGTLLVIGPHDDDHHSARYAPRNVAIDATAAVGMLDRSRWTIVTAENRTRAVRAGMTELTLTDVVITARRSSDWLSTPTIGTVDETARRSGTP